MAFSRNLPFERCYSINFVIEGYFGRIKSLEATVAVAQKKLEDAYESRTYAR